MAPQFSDEGLAETHYLIVALAFGVKVGATLCAAHWKGSERVLECLLKSQVFEDAYIYRWVEADTALVGANGVVVLYAVTGVDLYLAVVIHPCYTECEDAVGDAQALYEVICFKFGVLVVLFFDRVQYLFNCLEIFRLVRESSL